MSWHQTTYKVRVSSRAIIVRDDAILLNCFGDGQYYNFPGGGIEENETAKQAVAREVLEESGLTVKVGELVFSLEYEPKSCSYSGGDMHHISFFFRCYLDEDALEQTPSNPDVNPDDPSITSKTVWVQFTELNKINLLPNAGNSLLNYLETGIFSPSFWDESEQQT